MGDPGSRNNADCLLDREQTKKGQVKKGIICRIKSIQWPRLKNIFLTFKPPKNGPKPFAEQVGMASCFRSAPSSNIRPRTPSSYPLDISLASGPAETVAIGDLWVSPGVVSEKKHEGSITRDEVDVPHTMKLCFDRGSHACTQSWQLSQQCDLPISPHYSSWAPCIILYHPIPSYTILYFSKSPVLESTVARGYPDTQIPLLHSSKSCTNAGSLSRKVLQYFPTIRFHSSVEMNTRQSTAATPAKKKLK